MTLPPILLTGRLSAQMKLVIAVTLAHCDCRRLCQSGKSQRRNLGVADSKTLTDAQIDQMAVK